MISELQLTTRSVELLQRRSLSESEIDTFQALLSEAQEDMRGEDLSAREVLQQMSDEELDLVRRANSLADGISINELSEEGATNLLHQPDFSDRVDLNNDGIVEVGAARSITFPPVNAPDSVKNAWAEATEGMEESDVMMLQLQMHNSVYGFQIDGVSSADALPPEEQWSRSGIDELFAMLRGGLDFRVAMDGWTDYNKMLQGFYDRFGAALA